MYEITYQDRDGIKFFKAIRESKKGMYLIGEKDKCYARLFICYQEAMLTCVKLYEDFEGDIFEIIEV